MAIFLNISSFDVSVYLSVSTLGRLCKYVFVTWMGGDRGLQADVPRVMEGSLSHFP